MTEKKDGGELQKAVPGERLTPFLKQMQEEEQGEMSLDCWELLVNQLTSTETTSDFRMPLGNFSWRNCVLLRGVRSRDIFRDCRDHVIYREEMGRVKGLPFDLLRKKKQRAETGMSHCLSWQKALCLTLCPLDLYPGTWNSWDIPFLHLSQPAEFSCHCCCPATYLLETCGNSKDGLCLLFVWVQTL